LEGEPTVQGRRRCLSASRQTIAPAWGAGRMRTLKAIVCEKLSRDATSSELKAGWSEIAIERHALASRIAQDVSLDHELEFS
jgi:hypothetical protein